MRTCRLLLMLMWMQMFASGEGIAQTRNEALYDGTLLLHQTPLPVQRLTVEHGLSQNSVQCLLQDKQGFMWFGTSDGLNRFDGYSFQIFRHNDHDSASLTHSWVGAMIESRSGTIWVGTAEGISVYNPKTETFRNYKHNPRNSNSLASDGVLSMLETRDGTIWVGMRQSGLCRFDSANNHFVRYIAQNGQAGTLKSNEISKLYEDSHGTLWVGTSRGLQYFNPHNQTFTSISSGHTIFSPRDSLLPDNPINELYEDGQGNFWVGTQRYGLFLLHPHTKTILQHWTMSEKPSSATGLASNHVKAILEDRFGVLWIGTQEGGLQSFDRARQSFTTYILDSEDGYGTGTHTIMRLYQDRSDVFWMATNSGGLRKYSPYSGQFSLFRHSRQNPYSLSHNDILSLHHDKHGVLWVGTYGGGLNRYDPTTRRFTTFHHTARKNNSLGYDYIRAFCEDSLGRMWIGTFGGGLSRFVPGKTSDAGYFVNYSHSPGDTGGLGSNYIWSLVADRKGNIWMGMENATVVQFTPATEQWKQFKLRNRDNKPLHSPIQRLYLDRNGTLWVGTWGDGLLRFDEASSVFQQTLQHERGDTTFVATMNVISILEDRRGAIWYGTYGGGLYRLESATARLTRFTRFHGLPNDVVYGVLEDEQGNIWASTNNGLSKIACIRPAAPDSVQSYTFKNYDVSDGLQSNEFNRGAYCKLRDGRLAFGGVNGFNIFSPSQLQPNPHAPDVVITRLQKFNQPVRLDTALYARSGLILRHTDTFFSFDFAGLEYTNPSKHQYMYKLENFDENWIPAGTHRSVNYTNLDAGEYVFRVKACNSDGVWSSEGASLRIVIQPPFWRTWWWRSLLIAGTCLLIYGIYRNRVRIVERRNILLKREVESQTAEIRRQMALLDDQARKIQETNTALMEKNQQLEYTNDKLAEADSFKTRILSMAAHDLKNPLGAIIGHADLIVEEIGEQHPSWLSLRSIQDVADRMYKIIKDLLDMSAVELGKMNLTVSTLDIGLLVSGTADLFSMQIFQKQQTLVMDEIHVGIHINGDFQRLQQVIENIVSNAVKYSPLGGTIRIVVKLTSDSKRARIEVHDEGQGLSADDKAKLFGFFQRLSAKPTGGESSTGVGLAIVKQIVELHNGRVWAESEEGHGTTFIVELPCADNIQMEANLK